MHKNPCTFVPILIDLHNDAVCNMKRLNYLAQSKCIAGMMKIMFVGYTRSKMALVWKPKQILSCILRIFRALVDTWLKTSVDACTVTESPILGLSSLIIASNRSREVANTVLYRVCRSRRLCIPFIWLMALCNRSPSLIITNFNINHFAFSS